MENSLHIIGFIAGTLTTVGYLPQVVRLLRTKSSNGVSPLAFGTVGVGVLLWAIYGILKHDWPIIIANVLTFALLVAVFTLSVKYKK